MSLYIFSEGFSIDGNWLPISRLQVFGKILKEEILAHSDQIWPKVDKEVWYKYGFHGPNLWLGTSSAAEEVAGQTFQ